MNNWETSDYKNATFWYDSMWDGMNIHLEFKCDIKSAFDSE